MAKLTVKYLQSLTAEDAKKIIRDDGALWGRVSAKKSGISIAFNYRFKWGKKTKDYSCGSWPKLSLAEIRQERDRARQTVAEGINPNDEKKASKISVQKAIEETIRLDELAKTDNLTVNDLYQQWIVDGVSRKDSNAELKRSFSKDVLPILGNIQIRELTDNDIRNTLKAVKSRGLTRSIIKLFNDINQMLKWAEKRKPWRALFIEGNPAELVQPHNLLPVDYVEERDRILTEAEIQQLAEIFTTLESNYASTRVGEKYTVQRPVEKKTQYALWICLSTLSRIGEILSTRWVNVDLEKGVWKIPSENSKNKVDHYVFLSEFSLKLFKKLHTISGDSQFIFPSRNDGSRHVDLKSVSKLVGDRQIRFKNRRKLKNRVNDNSLVLSDGQNGGWTPHDLRRTGCTMMQSLGVSLDLIDRCQNHVLGGSKVRRHYLHHSYEEEKREAWQVLGAKLSELISVE